MMEAVTDQATPTQYAKAARLYARLDGFLLNLLAAELGYFIFLMVCGVVVAILVYATNFSLDSAIFTKMSGYASSILWPVLLYVIALPLNMFGGFAGIVLNIHTRHQGYPGTGHLLNWIFLMSTAWLFLITLVFLLPGIAGTY